ncbi:MAG TPA: CmpA/NrtA family ABC transporter substrate-binding protein [Verrucomicrobiae bacterium]|nr:CmpA/NrtA family ABC transporter substrate-binding protein [Verrucomicrobiae bacterium]
MNVKRPSANGLAAQQPLRLGFVPLTDCAPLVMAQELGLFRKYGLRAVLSREPGWATIRDKVIYGELDAAHAVAGMPFAATLGLGSIPCDCLTALVLSQHGNAITLSADLWRRGVRDGATLRQEICSQRAPGGEKTFIFGAVSSFSSHCFLLRQWLEAAGIPLGRDTRIVIVPPPQMAAHLKAGHLDGFCAGEPWNSAAVQAQDGWVVTTSAELAPGHPEKVLMVRRDFAEQRPEEHLALVAALWDACKWCDAPENREQLVATLARPDYVNASAVTLWRGLEGRLDCGHGRVRTVPDFLLFHRDGANEPSANKAAWVLQHLRNSGLCPNPSALNAELGRRVFRADLFNQAVQPGRENRAGAQPRTFQTESVYARSHFQTDTSVV